MAAEKISPTLPAQARLIKLKKELKESKKKYSPEVRPRMTVSSENEDTHNKELRINVKSCKYKEVNNSPAGKKRSFSSKSQPSTSSENSNNNPQELSVASKIRKVIGKLTTFSNKKEEKIPREIPDPFPQKVSNERKKKKAKRPNLVSSSNKINEKIELKGASRTQQVTIKGTKQSSGQSSPKKKPSPKTETNFKNVFKMKKDKVSSVSKATKLLETTLKNVAKNPKLSDSAEVMQENIHIVPSPRSWKPISFKIQKRKVNKSTLNNHADKTILSPDLNECENLRDLSRAASTSYETDIVKNEANNNFGEEEAMEWEPIKESILRNTRDEIHAGNNTEAVMGPYDRSFEITINKEDVKCVYFVVDTNVLIQSLNLIKKLTLSKVRGFTFIIMVPWQVLKELDKLKSAKDHCVANCARRASKFLSELEGEPYSIIFQKQSKHFEDCHQVLVEVPDDHLIKCCCQLKNENKNVILLSNDNNLRVKASATGSFPSVPDSWVSALLRTDLQPSSNDQHCFESEPKESLDESAKVCAQFLLKTTKLLTKFLFDVVSYVFKSKHGELYELWLPSLNMSVKECYTCCITLTLLEPFKNRIMDVWKFYSEKNTYIGIKGIDVEKLGRNCILLAKSLHHLVPDISMKFDKDMGFLKTGNFSESICSYTSASSQVAQTFFKRMEDKFNSNLAYLNQLVSKILSQSVLIPDITPMLNMIDKNINVTNEASTAFLLVDKDEEMPMDAPEIIIFHKILLNFLEIKQDENILPLFTPEDIVIYINQERSFLYPAAVQWLSDIRRQFMEYKSVLREH